MTSDTISPGQESKKLLAKLQTMDIDVQACFQCGRCSAGCPITEFFDLTTMEVVRLAAYGVKDKVVEALNTGKPHFVCLNFANGDMVAYYPIGSSS